MYWFCTLYAKKQSMILPRIQDHDFLKMEIKLQLQYRKTLHLLKTVRAFETTFYQLIKFYVKRA